MSRWWNPKTWLGLHRAPTCVTVCLERQVAERVSPMADTSMCAIPNLNRRSLQVSPSPQVTVRCGQSMRVVIDRSRLDEIVLSVERGGDAL